jgi:hypothetical protein
VTATPPLASLAALIALCACAHGGASPAAGGAPLEIAYTGDARGEVAPCG